MQIGDPLSADISSLLVISLKDGLCSSHSHSFFSPSSFPLSYSPLLSTLHKSLIFQRFYQIFTMCGQASFFGNLARGKSF